MCMVSKKIFLIVFFLTSDVLFASCQPETGFLALKDTILDCYVIKVRYMDDPICGKKFFVGSTIDKKRSCKQQGKNNEMPNVRLDPHILVYDTLISDTSYKVYLNSLYNGDDLTNRWVDLQKSEINILKKQ